MTIIWLFVTVTAGLRPNANISKSIHWQFNYTVSTEKEKRNIRFPFRSAFDWTANRRVCDGALARNMWEQLAANVTEQNIGRIHFGGACQLPVNVKLMVPLPKPLRMPCGSQSCDAPYQTLLLVTAEGGTLQERLRGSLVIHDVSVNSEIVFSLCLCVKQMLLHIIGF